MVEQSALFLRNAQVNVTLRKHNDFEGLGRFPSRPLQALVPKARIQGRCVTLISVPRKRGPYGRDNSAPVAVRLPLELREAALHAAGGQEHLAEWLRNVVRRALGRPLDYQAGYQEGKMQGWSEASQRFREALKGAP